MKIGVLFNDESPLRGGGFTFEHELLDALHRVATESSHQFVILDAPRALARPSPANIEWRATGAPEALHRWLRRGRRLRINRLVSAAGVDAVWNLGGAHTVTDAPYVTTVWDLQHRLQPFFPEVSAGTEWATREKDFATRLRRAAAVIAGTEVGKAEIVKFFQVPEPRIHVLPHPTPRFALEGTGGREVLARFNLPERYLFYPAQFWPHKNHVNLLWALKHLRDELGLRFPLVLVGSDKGNAEQVRRCAKNLGLEGAVHFLGFVSQSELIALYRHALALTYVTHFGPENLPPLEAFALGCPVVASDVPGALEQLGDAALRVDPTSPPQIAQAIRRIVEDGAQRDSLIARGRVRAERWTGEHFVRGVFGILDRLVPFVRCWRSIG